MQQLDDGARRLLGCTLALGLALTGCQSRGAQVEPPPPPADPAASGTAPTRLREYWLHMNLALYCARAADVPTAAAVAALVRQRWPRLAIAAMPGKEPRPTLHLPEATIEELPPPAREHLRFMAASLSEAERDRLAAARGVRAMTVLAPTDGWAQTTADLDALVGALADRSGCFVFDESAESAFSPASWRAQRVATFDAKRPTLASHIVTHAYRDGELLRIVTLGMEKAGLPDLSVDQVPTDLESRMEALIHLVCDAMAQAADGASRLVVTNEKRRIEVALRTVAPAEGDRDNRQVTLDFPGRSDENLQQRQHHLLDALFGPLPIKQLFARPSDEELQAASRRARTHLPELRARFQKGLPYDQHLNLKIPVHPEGETEWMWIEVTSWKGSTIHGVLHDDSFYASGPRAGARIKADERDVFDYHVMHRDGREEGNETSAVLERQQAAR